MLNTPVLIILYPSELHRVIPIPEGKSIIGRGIDADIRLDDSLVSRKHAEITRSGLSITIKDLESTNGTFVNRSEISETELQPFSELELGTTILKFEWKDSSEDDSKNSEPACLSRETFESYAQSISVFSARNNLPMAALYVRCNTEESFTTVLQNRIAKIIANEKRPSDLLTVAVSENNGYLEFALIVPHLKREDAISETCAIRDAIREHHFCINEKNINLDPKFGFAYVDSATPDICKTLLENAKENV